MPAPPSRAALPLQHAWGLFKAGERDAARSAFSALLGTARDHDARVALAMTAQSPPELAGALRLLQEGLATQPDSRALWGELVALLVRAGHRKQARDLCLRRLQRTPEHGRLWLLLGQVQASLGEAAAACTALERAEALMPENPVVPATLARLYAAAGRPADAVAALDRAIALAPSQPGLRVRRAEQLLLQKDLPGAAAGFRAALARGAELAPLACLALIPLRNVADWRDHDPIRAAALTRVEEKLAAGGRSPLPPGQFLAAFDDGELHRKVAASWCPVVEQQRPLLRPRDGRPIRVGYLSADYRNHAMGHLTSGVLAGHDRRRFEVVALSRSPVAPGDRVQERIRSSVDRWVDLGGLDRAGIVERVRALELDVLVDLMGHTEGHALGACGRGLAPVQLTWLGYPGTTGAPFFDHVVVDPETGADGRWFSENRLVLPHSYQPPNPAWVAGPRPSRSQLGLPEDAVVLGSFCQAYKLGPRLFGVWMDVLKAHPQAVLWQIARPDTTRHNLSRAVAAAGVDPERLVFASYVDHAAHLARLSQVDLGLDSLCWGAHTTARELLWAGVPFVTRRGDQLSARVGAGLLRAAGLGELVVESLDDYADLVSALVEDGERRAALRARVEPLRSGHALFSLPAFLRAWEGALEAVLADARAGRGPRELQINAEGQASPLEAPC